MRAIYNYVEFSSEQLVTELKSIFNMDKPTISVENYAFTPDNFLIMTT